MKSEIHIYCESITGEEYDPLPFDVAVEYYNKMQGLDKKSQEYQKYRHKLICSCLRWGIKCAYKFKNKNTSFPDLVEEANIAITNAVDQWKPKLGRLPNFVTKCIKNRLTDCFYDGDCNIRLPATLKRRTRQQIERIKKLDGLSVDEISARTKILRHRVLELMGAKLLTEDVVKNIHEFEFENGDVPDENYDNQETIMDDLKLHLSEKSLDMIKRRFGFNGYEVHNLIEIGSILRTHNILAASKKQYAGQYLNDLYKHLRTVLEV